MGLFRLAAAAALLPASADAGASVMIDMYSDAQCPCSAQATSDLVELLRDPDFSMVDLQLWFVGGGVTGTEPGQCKWQCRCNGPMFGPSGPVVAGSSPAGALLLQGLPERGSF